MSRYTRFFRPRRIHRNPRMHTTRATADSTRNTSNPSPHRPAQSQADAGGQQECTAENVKKKEVSHDSTALGQGPQHGEAVQKPRKHGASGNSDSVTDLARIHAPAHGDQPAGYDIKSQAAVLPRWAPPPGVHTCHRSNCATPATSADENPCGRAHPPAQSPVPEAGRSAMGRPA
jgi:hypothetical protein